MKVCLSADAIDYPAGGGHLWAYLNWALGLRAVGCEVVWLEGTHRDVAVEELRNLRHRLEPYGLAGSIALYSRAPGIPLPPGLDAIDLEEAAAEADLLLNLRATLPQEIVSRFRRSALLDIDPGLLQLWIARGQMQVAPHDVYFTIGEGVGGSEIRVPDASLVWHHAGQCVALDWWQPDVPAADGAFTTVSHWFAEEWVEENGRTYRNDKRSGFLPFLDLPSLTTQPLELALMLDADESERESLVARGWRVRDAHEVASTPWDYRAYIAASRGEFSCAKPSYVRLQNAWVSDRTLCYLASGKPAVVQHTGPSSVLPDAEGLFRFRDLDEAARCLEAVAADYGRQCSLARVLAEEYFDARSVVTGLLEIALC